jgi:hypothetical protein
MIRVVVVVGNGNKSQPQPTIIISQEHKAGASSSL